MYKRLKFLGGWIVCFSLVACWWKASPVVSNVPKWNFVGEVKQVEGDAVFIRLFEFSLLKSGTQLKAISWDKDQVKSDLVLPMASKGVWVFAKLRNGEVKKGDRVIYKNTH